eukprot:361800-Chlamydomonas_euryale.AAC.1
MASQSWMPWHAHEATGRLLTSFRAEHPSTANGQVRWGEGCHSTRRFGSPGLLGVLKPSRSDRAHVHLYAVVAQGCCCQNVLCEYTSPGSCPDSVA